MCEKCPKTYNKMEGSTGSKLIKMIGLMAGVQTYSNCSCTCNGPDLQVSQVGQQKTPYGNNPTGNTGSTINTMAFCPKCQHSFLMQTMTIS